MKKLIALVFVTALAALGAAQTRETFEERKLPAPIKFSGPIEPRLIYNGANGPNSPFRDPVLIAWLADVINNDMHAQVGASPERIGRESGARNAMFNDRWVDNKSPRFTPFSQKPALWAVELSFRVTPSISQHGSITLLGNLRIKGSVGSSEGIAVVSLWNLVDNDQVTSSFIHKKHTSINLNEVSLMRATKSFLGFRLDNIVDWKRWDNNADYRTEMLSAFATLKGARQQMALWAVPLQ